MNSAVHPANVSLAFVLDDEPQIGELVCKMLASAGLATRQFVCAATFFAELRLSSPDLIVLDLALAQTDAVEVIQQLEAHEFSGRVLLMSGHDQGTLEEVSRIGQAHGLCMLPSLRKPFRSADLKQRISATPQMAVVPSGTKHSAALVPQTMQVKVDLGQALANNWLEMWYQPKFALGALKVSSAEALARVRHPEHGLIAPSQFLPPVGDPLYHPLSLFIVRQTMAEWAVMADAGLPLKLAVNIPASVLRAPGFVALMRQLTPTDPRFPGAIIEVTEDELIRDSAPIYEIATQLRLQNLWISIDDFGTANASLSRLKDLPFAELKLDRSFVSNCHADPLKRALCQSVVDLAHRFDALACAEGVETEEELHSVRKMGFDLAQGFLFARPMPLAEFLAYVRDRGAVRTVPGSPMDLKNEQRWSA